MGDTDNSLSTHVSAEAGGSAAPVDVLVTFAFETWRDALDRGGFRPPERLVSFLTRQADVGRVVVANPYRSVMSEALRMVRRHHRGELPGAERDAQLVQPIRLRRLEPSNPRSLERSYQRYDARLQRAAQRAGATHPLVITTNPIVAGFASFDWATSVLYYARDDWAAHSGYERIWPAIEQGYQRLASRGVKVAAVTQLLLDRISGGEGTVVPNGIAAEEWLERPPQPDWMRDLPRPIGIYTGMLDERLSPEMVAAAAEGLGPGSLVLVGPTSSDPTVIRGLRAAPNVVLRPRVLRDELVATVTNADLGLLLHRRNRLTNAMSPLKLYEYVAAGLPVVATKLPGLEGIHPAVELVPSAAEVTPAVRRALDAGRLPEEQRQAFLLRNDWGVRFRRLLDAARP